MRGVNHVGGGDHPGGAQLADGPVHSLAESVTLGHGHGRRELGREIEPALADDEARDYLTRTLTHRYIRAGAR